MEDEVSALKNVTPRSTRRAGIYSQIADQGHIPMIDLPQYYRERNILEEAESCYIREIRDIHQEFGDTDYICMFLKSQLASTYSDQGHWDKAEKLQVQVMETCRRLFGPEHPDTLTSMANLAATYNNQGQ